MPVKLFKVSVMEMNRQSYMSGSLFWLFSLAISIESFLAFGLLSAVADIAENMIEVGNYVRSLKKNDGK